MSKDSFNRINKICFTSLILLTVALSFFPMFQIHSTSVTILDVVKSPAMLIEFGNYKAELPVFLSISFILALLSYLISIVLMIAEKNELTFLCVLFSFLGNVALFVYLLPPLLPENISYFTVYLFCYLGLILILLIYSFYLTIKSDFGFKLKYMYIDSVKQLSATRNLAVCGVLAALAITLNFASIQIPLFQVGVSGLPNRIVDFLFGPTIGMIFAGVVDAVETITKGYQFSIGYNLQAILGGLIYGTFYYNLPIKKPHDSTFFSWIKANLHSFTKILVAQFIVKIFLNIIFGTYLYSIFYGKAFWAILPGRTIKNLIQIPADAVVHFFLLVMFQKFRRYLLPDEPFRIRKPKTNNSEKKSDSTEE